MTDKKLAANRRNLAKAGPLTPQARARIGQAAQRERPWEHSTGPRTPEGKAMCCMNALRHGQETAEKRAFRRDALRFIRLDLELRRAMLGMRGRRIKETVRELVYLADRLATTGTVP